VAVAVALVLQPSTAFAWGPGAHIDFGLRALEGLALLAAPLRRLLEKYPDDFLYGCCAGDIIVGKNLAPYRYHCHNWRVGFRLLDQAVTPAQAAVAHGFLAHLAADTVAHNYFIPYKTVESFKAPMARHAYWELRFDQIAHSSERVVAVLQSMNRSMLHKHDDFLSRGLAQSSRIFSFRMSQRFFDSFLVLQRLRRWCQANALVARRSSLLLTDEEVAEYNLLATDAVFLCLKFGENAPVVRADPTGMRNLRHASLMRKELRLHRRKRRLDEEAWPAFLANLRIAFREAIYGPLRLPPLPALAVAAPRRRAAQGE